MSTVRVTGNVGVFDVYVRGTDSEPFQRYDEDVTTGVVLFLPYRPANAIQIRFKSPKDSSIRTYNAKVSVHACFQYEGKERITFCQEFESDLNN